ncbi:MAG: HAMP domain-containing histidine kinase [Caldilineaceae bacterium]|nr:HAMP domain-containing histidine kinase [Caldilineaceae bacterium]
MNRLWVRLALAFLLVTWAVLAVVTIVIYQSVQNSFRTYVSERNAAIFGRPLVNSLVEYYARTGTWTGSEVVLAGVGGRGEGRGAGGLLTFVAGLDGIIAAATDPAWIGRRLDEAATSRTVPLTLDGQRIGTLGQQTPGDQALLDAESQFTTQVNDGLLLAAASTTVVALLLGIVLAVQLTRPLQRLTARVSAWSPTSSKRFSPTGGTTEVRRLAAEFDAMSARLARAEELRQQMAADVAHELRTPVTVLRGHLEAMMDGVYPLDGEHLAVAYDQALHLNRLVEDLRLLTQAEAGRLPLQLEAVEPEALVRQAVARFAPLAQDAGIELTYDVEPLPAVTADAARALQIFDNLLSNALRHTAAPGRIAIRARAQGDHVEFTVSNSGMLDPDTAAHLFDRFWRSDEARARDQGGSGLGLAITRQLVLLQGGSIGVEGDAGETRFVIQFPISPP